MKTKKIILIGMSGCGKTTIGKSLAKELFMDFVDTDEIIELKQQVKIKDIFEKSGETFFRNLETECAKDVSSLENTVIATGGGIVLREENMRYLKQNSVVIYIKRTVDSIKETMDSSNRPLLKNNLERLYEMEVIRAPLYEKYADFIVINEKSQKDATCEILNHLKK